GEMARLERRLSRLEQHMQPAEAQEPKAPERDDEEEVDPATMPTTYDAALELSGGETGLRDYEAFSGKLKEIYEPNKELVEMMGKDWQKRRSFSTKMNYQPYQNTLEELYDFCKERAPIFFAKVRAVAKGTGGRNVQPKLKGMPRCRDKAQFKYKDKKGEISWHRLTDIVRDTIVYKNLHDMYKGLQAIHEDEEIDIIEFNDRYMNPLDGYRVMAAVSEPDAVERCRNILQWGKDNLGSNADADLQEMLNDGNRGLLHKDAKAGNAHLVSVFLDFRADVNRTAPKTRRTPLHEAMAQGHERAMWALLCARADLQARDSDGQVPLLDGLLKLRQSGGGKHDSTLDEGVARLVSVAVQYAERGLEQLSEAQGCLVAAVKRRLVQSQDLIAACAGLNGECVDGNLPKVKQLLAEWADPNTPSSAKDGHPPLHAVLLRPQGLQPVHLDIVRALVDMDANLSLTTTMPAGEISRTFTLVHSALHSKSGQALKILAAAGLRHGGKLLREVLDQKTMQSEEQEPSIWSLLASWEEEERVRLLDESLAWSLPDILALGATPGQVKALHQKAGLETPEEFLRQVVLKGLGPKELGEKLRGEPDFLTPTLPLPPFDAVREALQKAPADLRNDRDVVLACISHDAACLADVFEALRSERSFLLDAVQRHPRALEFAGGFREDGRVGLQLCTPARKLEVFPERPQRFRAPETTKAREDRDFVAEQLEVEFLEFWDVVGNRDVLEFAGGLRSDRQLAFEAWIDAAGFREGSCAWYGYVSGEAVQHAPWALDLLDAELQHDPVLDFHAVQALAGCGTRDVDLAQMSELRSVKHGSQVRCACATGANRMAVGGGDGSIWLHDLGGTGESASKLLGHKERVRCLCLLSEEVLASGSDDHTVWIWNLRSKEALQVLSGHTKWVMGLARLSDTQLASASEDKTIRLWNVSKPEEDGRVLQGHRGWVQCLCRTSAGSLVSGSDDRTLRVWNPDTGEELQELRGHTDVVICLCQASAEVLASGSEDKTVRLWSLTSWTSVRVLERLTGRVSSLCLLAPNHLAAADREGRLIVWAVESGEPVHEIKSAHSEEIRALTLAKVRGEPVLCSGSSDSTLKLWQLQVRTFCSSGFELCHMAWGIRGFSKDPNELRSVKHDSIVRCACATGANRVAVGCEDGSILLHDLGGTGESVSKLLGHKEAVRCLCLLSEEVLASGSNDNTIRIWNLRSKEVLQVLSGHTSLVLGLVRLNDTQLASASFDRTIRLWNLAEPEEDGRVLKGHSNWVRCLCRTSAGSLVSGSDDETLRVWKSDTGEEVRELRGHTNYVNCLCQASPELLASGSADRTVRLWDLASWTTVRVLEGLTGRVSSLCLLAPNHLAAADREGRLIVWAVESGEPVHEIKSAHSKEIGALTVATVRGGHVLCSGSEDSTLKLWQLQAGGKGMRAEAMS
ncbi:unnamed protein product, partial [Symbiodinium necroappetens]